METDMTAQANTAYALDELNQETKFGGVGGLKHRDVPRIDLSDFANRKQEIADQLWNASVEIGFFQLVNHGIPQAQVDEAFDMTARFFALPAASKAQVPLGRGTNAGWEYKSQVRPSTGTADQKESYQITLPRMASLWPDGRSAAGLQGGNAGVRAGQLGTRHESAVLLCADARFQARLLHRGARPAIAGISEHAASVALFADA